MLKKGVKEPRSQFSATHRRLCVGEVVVGGWLPFIEVGVGVGSGRQTKGAII